MRECPHVRQNLVTKTGCSCQSTRVWQRHCTGGIWCGGAAKPELIDCTCALHGTMCTVRSLTLFLSHMTYCRTFKHPLTALCLRRRMWCF